jgi:hypothetical protein
MVGGLGAVAELGVLAGGALGANRLQIDGGEDSVLGLDNAGGLFFEECHRGLPAAGTLKYVNIQARHRQVSGGRGKYMPAMRSTRSKALIPGQSQATLVAGDFFRAADLRPFETRPALPA